MDILIFGGQSNMQGQTDTCPEKKPIANAYEYRLLQDKLVELCHPVGENIEGLLEGADQGNGSLIPDFCRVYTEQTNNNVTAVHTARGATTIAQWLPTDASGIYYLMIKKIRSAIRMVQLMGEQIDKIYLIWLQGESDAIEGTDSETYKSRIRCFRDHLKADIGIDGFCFIRVGKFVGDKRDDIIIGAQEELCCEDGFHMLTRVTGVCTQDINQYINPFASGHFNNAAMTLIGSKGGSNLARLRLGHQLMNEDEPYEELRK